MQKAQEPAKGGSLLSQISMIQSKKPDDDFQPVKVEKKSSDDFFLNKQTTSER